MLTSRAATRSDYPELTQLWRASVEASHAFLKRGDREAIQGQLPTYFDQVALRCWSDGGQLIGFSGRVGDELVMLFLAPAAFHQGYGTEIINRLNAVAPIKRIDVNEQNGPAVAFYRHLGFQVIKRDALDDAGRPYPILHLYRDQV